MVVRTKKICKKCGAYCFYWRSGLCYKCSPHKKYVYKRKKTGELELFKLIWGLRHHICTNCGVGLPGFNVGYFSHIRSKGSFGAGRLDPSNVRILCIECHYAYDFRGKEAFEKRSRKNL